MYKLIVITFVALGAFVGTVHAEAVCLDAKTTLEINECLGGDLDLATKKLTTYLKAAQSRLNRERDSAGGAKIDLTAAQSAWVRYRDKHCGDVYTYWSGGTIRNAQAAKCNLTLTRERTHAIWSAYLTYLDSTPPVLPKP